jgi:acylpyruvate hydrolase
MRLATIRIPSGTRAVRLEGDELIDVGLPDVGAVLSDANWRHRAQGADGPAFRTAEADFAPLVPRPGKVVCVGLNYRSHILEMGRQIPEYPTLFAKFAETLIGAHDDVQLPPESLKVDWEAELALVIGTQVRRATDEQAADAIAGFTVLNDVSMRDWQNRTPMWDQGKTWESSTPVGPFLVTSDEVAGGVRPAVDISCDVNGETMQSANTADLVFDPVFLVRYISTIVTLNPGDVIATGTPGGVGQARDPQRFLTDGGVMVTTIDGVGQLRNRTVAEVVPPRK